MIKKVGTKNRDVGDQGDQIRRFFAFWAIFLLWEVFFFNYREAHFLSTFFLIKIYASFSTRNGLGYTLNESCTNPSGHPVGDGQTIFKD
jgi:hypothetical protein